MLQPDRLRAAEEIRADADMVEPGGLDEIDDVVGDLRSVALGAAPWRCSASAICALGSSPTRRLAIGVARALSQLRTSWLTKPGTKVAMTMPPLSFSRFSTSSGALRGWSQSVNALECERKIGASLTSSSMRMPVVAHMRAVDDHAEPVALADHGAAEGVEAVVARRVGRRIDPVQRLVVAGDQHARAGRVPDAQRRQRVLQPDAALDDDVGGDLAGRCARARNRRRSARAGTRRGGPPRCAGSCRSAPASVRAGWGALVGWNADQNCAPTPPSRRRGMSVSPRSCTRVEIVGEHVAARARVVRG